MSVLLKLTLYFLCLNLLSVHNGLSQEQTLLSKSKFHIHDLNDLYVLRPPTAKISMIMHKTSSVFFITRCSAALGKIILKDTSQRCRQINFVFLFLHMNCELEQIQYLPPNSVTDSSRWKLIKSLCILSLFWMYFAEIAC